MFYFFLFTSLAPSADLCDCILLGSLSPMSNTPDSLGLQFFALNETYVKDLLIEKREDEEPSRCDCYVLLMSLLLLPISGAIASVHHFFPCSKMDTFWPCPTPNSWDVLEEIVVQLLFAFQCLVSHDEAMGHGQHL